MKTKTAAIHDEIVNWCSHKMKAQECTDCKRGCSQAGAQLESIREMVKALVDAEIAVEQHGAEGMAQADFENARTAIEEDPLSVESRSGWHTAGTLEPQSDAEYNILLCTGGPAVRIIGTLDDHAQPESARLEYQDWGTPWTERRVNSDDEEFLLTYCRCFYFGD